MDWLYFTIISLLIVGIFLAYKKGIKKGASDFLMMLLEGGFESRVDAFREQNKHAIKGGMVFVGDSLTQEYNISEYLPGMHVYNRGIGGDTTVGLLTRLDVSIYDLAPSKMFLLIGTNDFALLDATPQMIVENIKLLIKSVKEKQTSLNIYLLSLYPVNPNMDKGTVGKRLNEDIMKVNQTIQSIEGITYINMYDALLEDGVLNPKYTREGLHLNPAGYSVVTDILKPYLES